MTEDEARAALVAEARTWIGTPYHHNAAVKGAGVDCGRILIEIFSTVGLTPPFDPGYYPADYHLHRDEERYLQTVERYLPRIDDDQRSMSARGPSFSVLPGDVVVWRIGRVFSHGAIVTEWPNVIHSAAPERFVLELDMTKTKLSERPMMVCSFWSDRK